jgi:anaerobic magnesium-protoporphyrin IX monomethyl ester cyclase
MKVVLVNPPLRRMVSANLPAFVEEERGSYPPMGLLYIAATLRERGSKSVEVKVLDTVLEDLSDRQIEDYLRREAPDVVGTQVLTFTLFDSLAVTRMAKKVNPQVVTVLGGRHCDIYPAETAALPGVDFVITGEGELPFTKLVEHLLQPDELEKIPGLTFRRGERLISNPPQMIDDLDDLPFPARDLTAYRNYRFLLAKKSVFTTLITSRGCPYGCAFCDEGRKKFRAVSAPRVVEEILYCKEQLGIDQFFIFDSTFTVDRRRVLDICELLVQRRANVAFDVRSRVNLIDDEVLKALKKAGCIRIQYGVESGNDEVLKAINKNILVQQVREVVRQTHKYDFEILCDFMIGLPGETEKEVEDTIRLALELPIDYAQFAITVPYPNTGLYELGMRKGIFNDYWREFAARPTPDFQPRLWEEHLGRDQLIDLMMRAYERFYYRPSYLIREFGRMRSLTEVYHKTKAGLHLMGRSIADRLGARETLKP